MLSLDNSYNLEELRAFDVRCQRLADGKRVDYVAEMKIDGLSLSLHYEQQLLARGVTRGDGRIGEDVDDDIAEVQQDPLGVRVAFYGIGRIAAQLHHAFDLVLCRNTVIYFTEEVRDALHARLVESLRTGGYLIVGTSERVADPRGLGLSSPFHFIYRKDR